MEKYVAEWVAKAEDKLDQQVVDKERETRETRKSDPAAQAAFNEWLDKMAAARGPSLEWVRRVAIARWNEIHAERRVREPEAGGAVDRPSWTKYLKC